ncbi:MAG: DUF1080 domain-containing protein [Kiritimatiellae bacterium]|nr:DUF1080 domain-containing protein [Kiritimatiellia bacterium]
MKKSILVALASLSVGAMLVSGCTTASECPANPNCVAKACPAKTCAAKADCKAKAKCCFKQTNCPYGNWALYLPYDRMNAGHLILSKDEQGNSKSLLLWRWASPYAQESVKIEGDTFVIADKTRKPKGKENDKSAWRTRVITGKVSGCKATCKLEVKDGNEKVISTEYFMGKRNPPMSPAPDLSKAVYGEPIDIIAAGMNGFTLMEPEARNGWSIKDGILSNRIARDENGKPKHGNGNIRTKRSDFYDFKLTYDVKVLPGCNSGMYIRGIYEIQVIDSYGKKVDCHNMAAFYGRITPSVAAEKPANEWQKVEVVLWKRHVTVTLNGVKIIDNAPVEGITGGAMTPNEFVPGPLYIQGDHSDADYRNLILTPILN